MQKTLKKTLSIILAVLMIVSVMPVSMAEITKPQAFWGTDINNLTGSGSLQDALDACSSDEQIDYIQLQQDIDVEQDLDIPLRFGCNQPVTLDLNGCTLKNRSYVVTVRSGSLTITDTSDEGCGAVVCDTVNAAAVVVFDGASFILENGTLESTYAAVMVYGIDGSCDITINGGMLKGAHCAISGVTAITNKITVNGGELFAGSQYTIQTYGLLTINGGTFIGKGRDGQICYYGGQIDMSGYSDPINMKIRNYSKEDVAVNGETFLLPEGYYFADADKNQVDTLNSYETYTIWKAHECYGSTEQSCLGYMCEFCGEYYGEKNDNHTDADDDKICDVCSLPVFDGEKLTIDVSTDVVFELGEGKAYYDPDGYILTGNNSSAYVYGNDECDITLDSVHLSTFDMSSAESKTIRVHLKGDSVVTSTFSVYTQNYIFTAEDENASLKVPSMNTSGQMGSVVFNGGRVEIDKTSGETPALSLYGGITVNDGIVTVTNAGYDTIFTPVVLNGGTLKATCTNAEYAPLSKKVTMAKGSLLILSSAGELLMDNGEIVMADNVGENAFFFVRFDTESEFALVRDINAALAGKTYAEIKVDTHTEHKFVDGKCSCGFNCAHSGMEDGTCDICGYVCTHENWTNGVCALCGFGCEHENWTDGVCDTCAYACTHSGMEDSTCDICGFVCEHETWTDSTCDLCGFVCEHEEYVDGDCTLCGYVCEHDIIDGFCVNCGYECPTVEFGIPTEIYVDPDHRYAYLMFVAPLDGTYRIYSSASENSDDPDPKLFLHDADYNELTYADDDDGYHFKLFVDLEAGETYYLRLYCYGMDDKHEEWFNVTVDAPVYFSHQPTVEEPWVELNEASEDVTYQWYTVSGDVITALEGETAAELSSVSIGVTYFCVATTYGIELKSVSFAADYEITHQPTAAEPWVTLNDGTGASYQWFNAKMLYTEITDMNADVITEYTGSAYDTENGWSADRWDSDAGSFFRANFKQGDIIRVIFSEDLEEETASLTADDLGIAINYTLGAGECWFVVPEDGYYELWSHLPSQDTTVKAYIVEPDKIEITDEIASPADDDIVYDSENGWSIENANLSSGYDIFDIELSKGDSILFEFSEELKGTGVYLDNYGDDDCYSYISLYGDEVILTAGTDEEYYAYVYDLPVGVSVKAYLLKADMYEFVSLEGETQAALQNRTVGESYGCEVTAKNGTILTSDLFKYKIDFVHQPTFEEPYVELNESEGATYQWYTIKDNAFVEVTDKNASGNWSGFGAPEELYSEYDAENGWGTTNGALFVIDLEAGDALRFEIPEGFSLAYMLNGFGSFYPAEGDNTNFVAQEDGKYGFLLAATGETRPDGPIYVKAYLIKDAACISVEGATQPTFADPDIANRYVCIVTLPGGEEFVSDIMSFDFAITHQPTFEEPYVALNNDTDATYQWYTVEKDTVAITDENATGDWSVFGAPEGIYGEYDAENGWSGPEGYFFITELSKGDVLTFDIPENMTLVYLRGGDGEVFDQSLFVGNIFTAPEDGLYGFGGGDFSESGNGPIDGAYITATKNTVSYVLDETAKEATLASPDPAKDYMCKIIVANGSELVSDVMHFEYMIVHQPTFEEPYVELNNGMGATYQWYTAEKPDRVEITDENAETVSYTGIGESTYDSENGWTGVAFEDGGSVYDFFKIDLTAGDALIVDVAANDNYIREVALYSVISEEITAVTIHNNATCILPVTESGSYILSVTECSESVTVKAWIGKTEYTEITIENANPTENNNGSSYSPENGWSADLIADDEGSFFGLELKKGDIVVVKYSEAFDLVATAAFFNTAIEDNWFCEIYGDCLVAWVPGNGYYEFWSALPAEDVTVKAYLLSADALVYTPVEGETEATLADPDPAKDYQCIAIAANGTELVSDIMDYEFAITHQPIAEELWVEVNNDTNASYQWYSVEDGMVAVTDDNATGDWSEFGAPPIIFGEYDAENGWRSNTGYFFVIELKAGDKVTVDAPEGLYLAYVYGLNGVLLGDAEIIGGTFTAPEDGLYGIHGNSPELDAASVFVTATVSGTAYTPVEGATTARLTPTALGTYVCEVTFADGTVEKSNRVEVTTLHTCAFGEWTTTTEKHWKECLVDGCGIISEEGNHEWTDGKCSVCEYECTHEEYEDGFCVNCGKECAHANTEPEIEDEVAADCVNDGYYVKVVYCTECGEEISRETVPVGALGHTDGETVIENEIEADCVNDGSYDEVVYCTECGEEVSRKTVPVGALGHTDGETVVENEVEADCVNDGSYDEVVYCTECGEEISRKTVPVGALGHTDGETVIENEVEADCVNDGSYDEVVYCTVCKKEVSRKTVPVKAPGHDYAAELTRPTATEKGYYTYTCSVCRDSYTEEVEGADYSGLEDAISALEELLADEKLTEDATEEYTTLLENLKNSIKEDRIESEQDEINALAEAVKNMQAELENEIEEGEAVVGDPAQAEAAIADALAGELTDEQKEALAEVEEEYAELLDKPQVTQKEINELIEKIEKILNPEIAVDECTCTCHHTDPFNKLVFKLIQFIRRLFGINSSCACGTVHTEGLTPIWKLFAVAG